MTSAFADISPPNYSTKNLTKPIQNRPVNKNSYLKTVKRATMLNGFALKQGRGVIWHMNTAHARPDQPL